MIFIRWGMLMSKIRNIIVKIISDIIMRRANNISKSMKNNPEFKKKTEELEKAVEKYQQYLEANSDKITIKSFTAEDLQKLKDI